MKSCLIAIVVLTFSFCASCSTSKKAGADYVAAYEQGRYAEAYESASRVADRNSGQDRERASLIAGLSAHRLDRNGDAERRLSPLLDSPDSAIAGRAGAALGLLNQESGNNVQAAKLLAQASSRLSGDEAARASMYAGDSYRALGQTGEAINSYTRAQAMVKDDSQLRAMIADRLASGAAGGPGTVVKGMFSVQVGAFSSQKNAQTEAVKAARFGSPRVVPVTSATGTKMFAVRIGAFATRPAAEALKTRIGGAARVIQAKDE